MKKAELISLIRTTTGATIASAEDLITKLGEAISALEVKDYIAIGTTRITAVQKKERTVRNPKTGESSVKPACKGYKIKVS